MTQAALLLLSTLFHLSNALGQPGYCNSTWSDHFNGSGTVTFSPGINIAQSPDGTFADSPKYPIPDPSWLVTVEEFPNATQPYGNAQFWFNTAGVEYWNDTKTLFDACAIGLFTWFPQNTVELSQNDPGDCSVMLTSECRSALTQRALSSLAQLTENATPPPHSNVSAGSLNKICADIANAVAPALGSDSPLNFPKECWRDYGYDQNGYAPNVVGSALTSPSSAGNNGSGLPVGASINSGLDYDCTMDGPDGKEYVSAGFGFPARSPEFAMTQGWPILSVWFQVANEEVVRESDEIITPTALLSCPRVTTIAQGSVAPSRLPSGHAVSNSIPSPPIHLSGGDIAGIVFGSTFALVLIAHFAHRAWRKRKEARQEHERLHGKPQLCEDHELGELPRYEASEPQVNTPTA